MEYIFKPAWHKARSDTFHRPTSKGNVRLQSSDPFQHPLIDTKRVCLLNVVILALLIHHIYSFLSTEHDLTVLERGMSILTRVMHTAPLADIIDHTASDKRLGHWLPTANLAELRAYIRSHLETLYHPTSTARMAPLSDCGVVDARLRVHGVQSLRVVDASVFPTIIAGHTVRTHSLFDFHVPRGAISNWHQLCCRFSIAPT